MLRFDSVLGLRASLLLCLSALLYGCGSTGPSQPEPEIPEIEITEVVEADAEPTGRTTRMSRAERRRARRSRAAEEESGDEAQLEPLPSELTQAYDRALSAMLGGDDTEAELQLEQLILQYPDYAGPYVNLAIIYRRGGRMEEARDALDRALLIDPGHAAANNQLGILHRWEGRFAEAEASYRSAIETDPNYVLAYYNLGVLLDLYLKRPAEALDNYERYQELQVEPDETVARWIIDLRRRVGVTESTARVAQEGAP